MFKKAVISAVIAATALAPTAAHAEFHNQGNYGQAVGKSQNTNACGAVWAGNSWRAFFPCPWSFWEFDMRG